MNRRALIRGIQLVVLITLASFAVVLWRAVQGQHEAIGEGLRNAKPGWLVVAALLALQEGVLGGLRMFTLCRVLTPEIRPRHGIISEFVLMFVAGVTPGQVGAPIAQMAVLIRGRMRVADVAAAEVMTAFCTVGFFLLTALGLLMLRARGMLVLEGGAQLDWLVGVSVVIFGAGMVLMILGATSPSLLHWLVRGGARVFGPIWHGGISRLARRRQLAKLATWAGAREGYASSKMLASIDDVHLGFVVYARRGKLAVLGAFVITIFFFSARFAVAYFILLGLGLPTEPRTFVAIGPPIFQVILAQALLNFALYLSPTPGASGIAEAGSTALMSPWVFGAHELPYLVLWRTLALFLCMFVGGIYVFRYLGTDVLEAETRRAAKVGVDGDGDATDRGSTDSRS